MPIITVRQLVDVLEKSQLLSSQQLDGLKGELARESDFPSRDALVLGERLVETGRLTPFQLQEVINHGAAATIGPYLLIDVLGEGGMGTVYSAENPYLKKRVALKVIKADALAGNSQAVERFRREMVMLGRLKHPSIIDALDAGQTPDGRLYLVMELLDGQNLQALIREKGPLAVDQACDCIRQTAEGLAYAHAKGILHRDIKPSNLLLCNDGTLKVLDLGLARPQFPDRRHSLTVLGKPMGTPSYMSPEQTIDATQLDERSDIYSLGCTFYHLLAGRPPFLPREGASPADAALEVMMMQREDRPVPLHEIRSDLPEPVCRLVARMLEKKPEDRPQSYAEMLKELRAIISTNPPDAEVFADEPMQAEPLPDALPLTEEPIQAEPILEALPPLEEI